MFNIQGTDKMMSNIATMGLWLTVISAVTSAAAYFVCQLCEWPVVELIYHLARVVFCIATSLAIAFFVASILATILKYFLPRMVTRVVAIAVGAAGTIGLAILMLIGWPNLI